MDFEGSKSPKNEIFRAVKATYVLGYIYKSIYALFCFSMKVLMVS